MVLRFIMGFSLSHMLSDIMIIQRLLGIIMMMTILTMVRQLWILVKDFRWLHHQVLRYHFLEVWQHLNRPQRLLIIPLQGEQVELIANPFPSYLNLNSAADATNNFITENGLSVYGWSADGTGTYIVYNNVVLLLLHLTLHQVKVSLLVLLMELLLLISQPI